MSEQKWYILNVKSGWEKKVIKYLSQKKTEYFIPCYSKETGQRRIKETIPVFKSYIFAKAEDGRCDEFRRIPGVINLVYWLNNPVTVPAKEIELMQKFVIQNTFVQLEKSVVDIFGNAETSMATEEDYHNLDGSQNIVRLVLPTLGYYFIGKVQKSKVRVITDYEGALRSSPTLAVSVE